MLKKISIILISIILILGICSNVNADELKTSLDIIQNASETKYLENDQGYVSKSIVDSNAETGEVTIELKLNNTKKELEETERHENTEIYLIISENNACYKEQLEKTISNIEKFSSGIFNQSSKTKIGIIGIKGTIYDAYIDEETGKLVEGKNNQNTVRGNENDAEIVVELTNNLETIKNGINNMNPSKTQYNTNLQAAIRLASKSYSNEANKILVSLYDGVPSIAIGVPAAYTYGGWFGEYNTAEEAIVAVHEKNATNTRNEILALKNNNISFILLRPDDTSYDETWYNAKTGEKTLDFDGSPYVQKIYGTIENPTYGKMYSFTNENVDKIITENIYQDVKDMIQSDINTTQIIDYFPQDITENFEFSYVGNPSIGTTTDTIDAETKTITWNIGTLKGDEVATLKYKLKLKDMKNEKLLNKTIATNEKVVLTYKDSDSKDYTVELTSSPKIQLSKIKDELIATISYNPTTNTTGNVVATIKTNKRVNNVDGWTLSDDGKTLTKTYSTNATETVHLVDLDGMTKDVEVKITNITSTSQKQEATISPKPDSTIAQGNLPQTGMESVYKVLLIVGILIITGGIFYFKFHKLKDIK